MWHETLASALGRELQADGKSGPAANDSVEHKASSGNHARLLSRGEEGASEKLGGGRRGESSLPLASYFCYEPNDHFQVWWSFCG